LHNHFFKLINYWRRRPQVSRWEVSESNGWVLI